MHFELWIYSEKSKLEGSRTVKWLEKVVQHECWTHNLLHEGLSIQQMVAVIPGKDSEKEPEGCKKQEKSETDL